MAITEQDLSVVAETAMINMADTAIPKQVRQHGRLLPLAPLEEALRLYRGKGKPRIKGAGAGVVTNASTGMVHLTVTDFVDTFGITLRQAYRWLNDGHIRLYRADECAVAMKMHPADIWGEAYWVAAQMEP